MSKSTTSAAGGRRFWVTVLCFAIANLGVWVGCGLWQKAHRHRLLEVAEFTPGDGAQVDGRPLLTWSFNLDVLPPGPKAGPPGAITPPVPGKWDWANARTLTFVPDAPLKAATSYQVVLNAAELRTADGFNLPRPYEATLQTPALQVSECRQSAFDDGDQIVVELRFNDRVLPADVRKHLKLAGSDGHDLPFHPVGEAPGHKVQVQTDPITHLFNRGTEPAIHVTLTRGLTGEAGPLGLEHNYDKVLSVAGDLVATDAHAYGSSYNDAFLQVRLNNAPDLDAIRQVLSVEPAVPFTLAGGYNGVDIHGPFEPGKYYTIKLAKAPAGIASKRVPRATIFTVLVPERQPAVWFDNAFGYLGAAGNRTVMAHVVNTADVRVTVTRVYDNNLVAWRNDGGRRGSDGISSVGRPLAVRDFHIPVQKNQKQDFPLTLDDLLPAGEARDGVYQIAAANVAPNTRLPSWQTDDDDYVDPRAYGAASTIVTLSDIGLSARQGRDGLRVWATSLRTARPLPGVRARLYSSKSQFLGEGTTDNDGLTKIIPLPAGPGEKPAVIIAAQPSAAEVLENAIGEARPAAALQNNDNAFGTGLTWLDLRGGEIAFGDTDVGGRPYLRNGFEAFLYTDRGVYRPGETVHLRAIVRGPDNVQPPKFPVRWQIRRPDLRDWKSQMGEIDADGATSLELPLPADLPTGKWSAQVGLPSEPGTTLHFFGSISFEVEDFMPQRMKVSVDLTGAPLVKGKMNEADRITPGADPLVAHVQADYLFGRPVSDRPAGVVARVDPVGFAPRAFANYTFNDAARAIEALGLAGPLGRRMELAAATLNADGHAKWDLDVAQLIEKGDALDAEETPVHGVFGHIHKMISFRGAAPASEYAGPWRLSITGSVTESGGRAITATRQVDVDRVPFYIGIKGRDSIFHPGAAAMFDMQLVTPTGAASSADASIEATIYRETWNSSYVYEHGCYRYQSTRVLEPKNGGPQIVSLKGGRGEISFTPPTGGSFVIVTRDPRTRTLTSLGFYAGYGEWEDNISRQNPEHLDLLVQPMPDTMLLDEAIAAVESGDLVAIYALADRAAAEHPRAALRIGERAQVIVRSPFAGRLLLSIENDGILSTQVLEMKTSHIAVPIDITEACRPNAYVMATVLRPIDPSAAWTAHRAAGAVRLVLDNSDRKLSVELAVPKETRPEQSLHVSLRVLDAAGHGAAGANVTVAAVDEGICRLTNFTTPDPFAYFFAPRALGVHGSDLFGQLMPEVAKAQKQSSVGGDGGDMNLRRSSPVVARRVRPVALVSAVLHTDEQGIAQTDFPLPQFSGQLRIMAVAAEPQAFGSAETAVLVRSPLLVQSSWPRFAAPSDRFSVSAAIFNNSTVAGDATVSIELTDAAAGPLKFAAANDPRLSLPPVRIAAGGQAAVSFDIMARDQIGVGHARLIATMNGERFEECIELPVRPASPTVTVGGYLAATAAMPAAVNLPRGFLAGTSSFELRVNNAPQLHLPEGLSYLDHYPYGCVEQTTSTLFPLVYLQDIGDQIAPHLFDKDRTAEKVRVGMLRLLSMQTTGGGLAMWPGGSEPWPWASVYAAHFLVEAHDAGFEVPEQLRDPLLAYLHTVLNQPEARPETLEVQAYASFVLARAGSPPRAVMSRLSEVTRALNLPSAQMHLAAAWLCAGRRDLASELIPQAVPAPRIERELGQNLGSPIRDRAILISTLLAVDPADPRIPDLVQHLAEAGRDKQWRSTQDIAFSVMAIGRYLRQSRSQAPYETAEVLLDGKGIASASGGRPLMWSASSSAAEGAAESLPAPGSKLEIRTTGAAGAIAHIAWMQTGVLTAPPPAVDSGIMIRRRLLDEHGKPLELPRVRSGDLVQVEITLTSVTKLEHVVIEDLLPAGLEIENPRLEGTAAGLVAASHRRARRDEAEEPPLQVVRTDMRDDRMILVGHLLRPGSGTYLYTARAVTAGKFVLPPIKAECMYDSSLISLWGTGTFEVRPLGDGKLARGGSH